MFNENAGAKTQEVCIISGGTVNRTFLQEFLAGRPQCKILCVDGGLCHAYEMDLPVDYIVGDFDTIKPEILKYYKERHEVPIHEFDPIKDNTDTDIALELAISWKPQCIYIVGGTGSRLDHTLGNIHILKKALTANIKTYLINEQNRISMIDHPVKIEKKHVFGNYISLIPFTEKIENLTLKGFKYPLENRTMVFGESLGISNEIVEETAEITFDRGILLVIEASD